MSEKIREVNNWFQEMFDEAHVMHQKTWNLKTHDVLPKHVIGDILSMSDAECITDVPIEDINDFLNDLEIFSDIPRNQPKNWRA